MYTFPILGALSIGLKLTGLTDWSWWFVLLPFYVEFVAGRLIHGVSVVVEDARDARKLRELIRNERRERKEQELMSTRDD